MNYVWKKGILLLAFMCLSLCCPKESFASHAAGGELIYEWVSDSTYRFYFKFYRDCSGIPEPDSQRMCYFNSCNNQSYQVQLQKMTVLPGGILNAEEVSPGCAGYYTNCSGGTLNGFREWWYSGTVTLPSRCDYWTFYISLNGRNPSDNIPSSSMLGVPLYLEATLNNLDVSHCSSPYFSVKPVPYVCANSPNTYNSGAIDPDNDSIAFEFIHPRTISIINSVLCQSAYSATDLPFLGGFSLTEPFATNNTFTFSPLTGQMNFTPALISVNTTTIRVNKYRNGKKIGSVLRDIQMKVVNCSSNQPSFAVIPSSVSGGTYINDIIEGTTSRTINFCFYARSVPGTILSVSDNHNLVMPGSSITYTNQLGDSATGCLSWTPSCTDTGLRFFAVTVKDSTCLAPGILVAQTFIIPIRIRPAAVPTERTIVLCPGRSAYLQPGSGNASVNWSVLPGGNDLGSLSCTSCRNPQATPDIPTTYIARYGLDNSGCLLEERFNVAIDTGRVIITPESPYILCEPDSIQLHAQATSYPFRSNLACGTLTTPGAPGDSAEILIANAALQRVQNNASTPFTGSYPSARHQYLIRAADIKRAGITSGRLQSIAFHISSFTPGTSFSNLSIALGCTDETALSTTAGFISTTPVYSAPGPVFITSAGAFTTFYFDQAYDWDTTKNLVVDICYANTSVTSPAYTYYFNSGYNSTLYTYAASGNVCNATTPALSTAPELPHMRIGFDPAPVLPYSYTWRNSTFFPSDTIENPVTYITGSTPIYAYTFNRYGCLLGDTLDVIIPDPPTISNDTGICAGDAIRLRVHGATSWQWYENRTESPVTLSCQNCADPVASPMEDIVYTVHTTDSFGCRDTLQVQVNVTELPDVRIINNDTLIDYGASLQLTATGATAYLWSPSRSLDNPMVYNPVATPHEHTIYVVAGLAADNHLCRSYDSVRVRLDFRGRFFVPSAFTPDGDGKNDLFRVFNLTFQKLLEFRVFNRWGQEVFSTTDERGGWDGAWKGVPQPVGVYHYLIRLAYPDGATDLYKGDVTLIR